jgi:hypothetical protein
VEGRVRKLETEMATRQRALTDLQEKANRLDEESAAMLQRCAALDMPVPEGGDTCASPTTDLSASQSFCKFPSRLSQSVESIPWPVFRQQQEHLERLKSVARLQRYAALDIPVAEGDYSASPISDLSDSQAFSTCPPAPIASTAQAPPCDSQSAPMDPPAVSIDDPSVQSEGRDPRTPRAPLPRDPNSVPAPSPPRSSVPRSPFNQTLEVNAANGAYSPQSPLQLDGSDSSSDPSTSTSASVPGPVTAETPARMQGRWIFWAATPMKSSTKYFSRRCRRPLTRL